MEYGEVRRALLGVQITEVSYERSQDLGLSFIGGAEIRSMLDDGAAAEAGLEEGDIIRKVADKTISEPNELQEAIALLHPGDTIEIKVWRSGEMVSQQVTLKGVKQADAWLSQGPSGSGREQQAPDRDQENENPSSPERDSYEQWDRPGTGIEMATFNYGFRVMAVSKPDDIRTYDMVVAKVESQSQAWKRGLREGDIITEVNGKSVEDLDALRDLIRASQRQEQATMFTVRKEDGSLAYYELTEQD
jgi:serine protease Do